MKQIIKEDELGLFVEVGGEVCRPYFGTCLKVLEEVHSYHFKPGIIVAVSYTASSSDAVAHATEKEIWVADSVLPRHFNSELQIRKELMDYNRINAIEYCPLYSTSNERYAKTLGREFRPYKYQSIRFEGYARK